MCGRYALHAHPDVIALQFGLAAAPQVAPRYNIAPAADILVVRCTREGERIAAAHRWGLVPGWAKDAAIGARLVNARSETVAQKPSFRAAFRRSRCLVPASGFYEWKSAGGRKLPYYIRPREGDLFGLAGITESWNGPQGVLSTVCLITTEPNELMRGIHDRMPVILAPDDYATWLDPHNQDAAGLLRPYAAQAMAAYAVSRAVSNARNEGPHLLEPAP